MNREQWEARYKDYIYLGYGVQAAWWEGRDEIALAVDRGNEMHFVCLTRDEYHALKRMVTRRGWEDK